MPNINIHDFMDFPALLIVVGTTAIMLMITGLFKNYFGAFKIAFGFCGDIAADELEKSITSVKIVMLSAFLSGLALSIVSLIGTMVNTTVKNVETLPINFAVSLLELLYGVILCITMIPLLGRLKKKKF